MKPSLLVYNVSESDTEVDFCETKKLINARRANRSTLVNLGWLYALAAWDSARRVLMGSEKNYFVTRFVPPTAHALSPALPYGLSNYCTYWSSVGLWSLLGEHLPIICFTKKLTFAA